MKRYTFEFEEKNLDGFNQGHEKWEGLKRNDDKKEVKEASSKMYKVYEQILNYMTPDQLCEKLVQAMDEREARENFEHIIQMWDLPIRI